MVKTRYFPPKGRNNTKMSALTTSFNIVLKVLVRGNGKKMK